MPAGLDSLTDAQDVLAAFLRIDPVLIEAAAQSSPKLPKAEALSSRIDNWLNSIASKKKDEWLLEFLKEPERATRAEILAEFRESQLKASGPPAPSVDKLRSIKELFAARAAHREVYERRVAKEHAAKKAEAARQAAKKSDVELDALSKRVEEKWAEIETTLASTSSRRFISAVDALTKRQALAARDGELDHYRARIQKLLQRHAKKPTFQKRVAEANLSR